MALPLQTEAQESASVNAHGNEQPRSSHRLLFWLVAAAVGLLQTWAHRNDVSPDAISYVEIAWATARFGLHQIVNAYWSPLYPFLLSLEFRWLRPSPYWEFTAAHFLNFAVYLASIAAFELFLKELIRARRGPGTLADFLPLSPRTLWIWGCAFFLWSTQYWLGVTFVTPDLCVAVTVFLLTAVLLRIHRTGGDWLNFAILGALLGVGYLAKAAMFPLAFVFLLCGFLLSRRRGVARSGAVLRVLLATTVFAAIALPWVMALSATKHRLTFGDVGRIAYATVVNRAPRAVHWQGQPVCTGTPAHPTRKIFSDPDVFEFASPVPGTYPPWYDPSYWYEGVHICLSVRQQLFALYRSANVYLKLFSKSGVLWIVVVAYWLFGRRALLLGCLSEGAWLALLPCAAALAMYALVLVEFRYVAPFALTLLMAAFASLRLADGPSEGAERPFTRFRAVVALAPALAVAWTVGRDAINTIRNNPSEPWIAAQQLHALGIMPGSDVAYIGTGLEAYWAHLASVRIVADLADPEVPRFVAADSQRRQRILALFSSLGAKAVVTRNAGVASSAEGWRPISGTHLFVWLPDCASPNPK